MTEAGRTLSATEFAGITGVARERLRTWERRHGFPEPVRVGAGARRYRVDDVPRVVAVRRSVERGVPLQTAMDAARNRAPDGISDSARAGLAEHAPVAIVVLSGPDPLRVEEVNALVRARPGAPAPGDDLLELAPWYEGHPDLQTLRSLFTGSSVAATCEHPDWTASMLGASTSIAYSLPQELDGPPLVALVGVDTGAERRAVRDLEVARTEALALRGTVDRQERWSRAAGGVIAAARERGGSAALTESVDALVRHTGALDAVVAPYMTGALVIGRSSRGLLGPAMVTVTAYAELGTALRDGSSTWMTTAAGLAAGTPVGLATYAVPVLAAGEPLGALLLLFDEQEDLTGVPADLLLTVSTVLGFVLVRERVLDELRT